MSFDEMSLLWCLAGAGWALSRGRPRRPVNVVRGMTLPDPEHPGWESVGFDRLALGSVKVLKGNIWYGVMFGTVEIGGPGVGRYARAVRRAYMQRKALEAGDVEVER